jgi:hypothetical protein
MPRGLSSNVDAVAMMMAAKILRRRTPCGSIPCVKEDGVHDG